MEAKLRFIGVIEVDAEAVVNVEEAQEQFAGLLQDTLAADCLENDGIWLEEHWWEDSTGFWSEVGVESSVKSISNIGRLDGNGDPSGDESDCPELVWEESWEGEDTFLGSVEVEDFVDSERLLETNEAGGGVGEGWEAPSWPGRDPWVLSGGGVDGKPFSIACSVKTHVL